MPPISTDLILNRLALSGGGFRATLFHIGLIEHLRDAGLLTGIQEISSVSGGSIVAAHLVLNWDRYTGTREEFESARNELLQFTREDVRGRIVRRLLILWWISPLIGRFLRAHGSVQPAATRLLFHYYDHRLFHGATLHELPATPRLHILATNLTKGCLTSFGQKEILHFPSERRKTMTTVQAGLTSLASAVTASSAYPALFPPLSLTHEEVGAREDEFEKQFFTDAGVTDNLGVQAFDWDKLGSADSILVSDAGQSFVVPHGSEFGFIKTALRSTDLMMFRIRELALAKVRQSQGSKALLVSISDCEEVPGAAPWAVQQPLEAIRTDLDVFSLTEAEELMRHGYFRSERVVGNKGSNRPEFKMDVKAAASRARQLVSGSRRKRRLLSRHDWVTWAQCVCLVLLAIGISYVVPPTVTASRVAYFKFRGLAIINRPLPEWTRPAVPVEPIIVPSLLPPTNAGFRVIREERIWDLRALKREASGKIVGPTRMERNTIVIRESPDANEYVYWFQTSGHHFLAWSLNPEFPIEIRTQIDPVIDGPSRMKAQELRIDVSRKRLHEKFLLTVQAESYDAFAEPDQWWIGMRVTDILDEASMRIVFSKDLRYRNPEFTKYPNNTAVREPFEGHALDNAQPPEILWWVPNAPQGMTYRVQWKW